MGKRQRRRNAAAPVEPLKVAGLGTVELSGPASPGAAVARVLPELGLGAAAVVALERRVKLLAWAARDVRDAVAVCRAAGCSWAQVSEGLGVSAQAAHRKYAALMPPA